MNGICHNCGCICGCDLTAAISTAVAERDQLLRLNDEWMKNNEQIKHQLATTTALAVSEAIQTNDTEWMERSIADMRTERALAYEMAGQVAKKHRFRPHEHSHSAPNVYGVSAPCATCAEDICGELRAASPNHDALIAAWREREYQRGVSDGIESVARSRTNNE